MPHTPKPWSYRKFTNVGCAPWEVVFGDGECVAESIYTEADARLIAAAPDLLAAVERARTIMSVEGENDLDEWRSVLAEVEAAIAKAKGA